MSLPTGFGIEDIMTQEELRKWAIEEVGELNRGSIGVSSIKDIIKTADLLVKYVDNGVVPGKEPQVLNESIGDPLPPK